MTVLLGLPKTAECGYGLFCHPDTKTCESKSLEVVFGHKTPYRGHRLHESPSTGPASGKQETGYTDSNALITHSNSPY
jgi:hypothetical protein